MGNPGSALKHWNDKYIQRWQHLTGHRKLLNRNFADPGVVNVHLELIDDYRVEVIHVGKAAVKRAEKLKLKKERKK